MQNRAKGSRFNRNTGLFSGELSLAWLVRQESCHCVSLVVMKWTFPLLFDSSCGRSPFKLQTWCSSCQCFCSLGCVKPLLAPEFCFAARYRAHEGLVEACSPRRSCSESLSRHTCVHCVPERHAGRKCEGLQSQKASWYGRARQSQLFHPSSLCTSLVRYRNCGSARISICQAHCHRNRVLYLEWDKSSHQVVHRKLSTQQAHDSHTRCHQKPAGAANPLRVL